MPPRDGLADRGTQSSSDSDHRGVPYSCRFCGMGFVVWNEYGRHYCAALDLLAIRGIIPEIPERNCPSVDTETDQ